MNLFGMLEVSGSALTAERRRAEVVTSNMATWKPPAPRKAGRTGGKLVVFRSRAMAQFPALLGGLRNVAARRVEVDQVVADAKPPCSVTSRGIPMPIKRLCLLSGDRSGGGNRRPVGAMRAYELNASAVQATKTMIQESLGFAALTISRNPQEWGEKCLIRFRTCGLRPDGAAAAKGVAPRGWGFMETLRGAMDQANSCRARPMPRSQAARRQGMDVHSAMIAVEKADLSFQLMMQVRNKIVSAYQEISRMQF